jgi:porphobilinogen synthase
VLLFTDECFCEYTTHGHCGILCDRHGVPDLDNDATLPLLVEQCVSHARAGADVVAPSGMLDGMVAAIRTGLDAAGFTHVPILSYAAKFASGFYGPFRDAAESPPQFGDRSTYQMDPANADEALREVAQEIAEGADMVMVKPALSYLDIIRRVKDKFRQPTAAYNVSGEFAMVKAAAANGWIDERRVTMEILTSIKRAGADMILTYHARQACEWMS